MTLLSDARILWQLTLGRVTGDTHAERLESFYRSQAAGYDQFRRRLLQGREELYGSLEVPEGGCWVELGGGTAANLEFIAERIERLQRVYVVDLSRSLLNVASRRSVERGWKSVTCVEADATRFSPPELVDVVVCSYSLTMIPDWFAVVEQARQILRPGGVLGVVDFYVPRKYPSAGHRKHSWWTRHFWPVWFAFDNVNLSADHLPYLEWRFETLSLSEQTAPIPYLPGVRVPYYRYVGRKPRG